MKWYIDRFLKGLPAIPAGLLCLLLDLCYAAVVYLTIGIIPFVFATVLSVPIYLIVDDYDTRMIIVRILFTVAQVITLPVALSYEEEKENKEEASRLGFEHCSLFILIVFAASITATWIF